MRKASKHCLFNIKLEVFALYCTYKLKLKDLPMTCIESQVIADYIVSFLANRDYDITLDYYLNYNKLNLTLPSFQKLPHILLASA